MNNIIFESDAINEYKQGKINWVGEILAKYEFADGSRVLHLETNGESDDIYLEIVDYDVVDGNLCESSFSEPLYEIESESYIEEEFLGWIGQD